MSLNLNNRNLPQKSKQKGFTLIEIIIALAVIGVAIGAMLFYQSKAENTQKTNETVTALTKMASDVKANFGPANTYVDVTNANLNNSGVTAEPFTGAAANITDPWGGAMVSGGSPAYFGMGFSAPDKETCMKLVAGLAKNAVRITVHTAAPAFVVAATTPAAFLTTGSVAKADATTAYSPTAAATGCGGNGRFIGVVYR